MADMMLKAETIRQIERLQLSMQLIDALEDGVKAECVVMAIASLNGLTEHWN